ncbi:MAG: ECF-type sigma factor [Pseudomonadota bacterium]
MEPDTPPKDFSVGGSELNANELFTSLYGELRRLASSALRRAGGPATLTPTAVLHEAYLDICGGPLGAQFPDRNRFMGYAARVMRGLVIDYTRRNLAQKRGGEFHLTSLPTELPEAQADGDELARIAEALDELAAVDPRLVEVVDLKYFCGFSFTDIAAMREVSERTVQRDWEKARMLLHKVLRDDSLA